MEIILRALKITMQRQEYLFSQVQWLKRLLGLHKGLSSDPYTPIKKLSVSAHTCSLATAEAQREASRQLTGQTESVRSGLGERPCLKSKLKRLRVKIKPPQ